MGTRKLSAPGLAVSAVVLLGVFSQAATATEEMIVYGADMTAAQDALYRSSLDAYVRSLNEQIKTSLDKDLRQVVAPKLFLADSETLTRS